MKKIEKYSKEILELIAQYGRFGIVNDKPVACETNTCAKCEIGNRGAACCVGRRKWANEEYEEKIKISRLEHELVKHYIAQGYVFITRDIANCLLCIYKDLPIKGDSTWYVNDYHYLILHTFEYHFSFVKWENEKPTLLTDILNYEVED